MKNFVLSLLVPKAFFAVIAVLICSASWAVAEEIERVPYGDNKAVGKFAKVNGIKMYYEIYGEGKPMILIHGNGGSLNNLAQQIEYFSKDYQVIVADSRGHGKSEMGEGELTYRKMAADWAALVKELKTGPVKVLGFSDGGILGLLMSIHHPESVERLAAMGANLSPDTKAIYPYAANWAREKLKVIEGKVKAGDKEKDWKTLEKTFRLLVEQPNIPVNDLKKIKAPVLILSGDKDIIREEHSVLIYQNIAKAQLCIFPGETHWTSYTDPELFNATVGRFFKKPFSRPDSKKILLRMRLGF